MEAGAGFLLAPSHLPCVGHVETRLALSQKQFCVHSFARGETRRALSLQHDTMTCPPKANGLMAFSVGHRPTCVGFISLCRTCRDKASLVSKYTFFYAMETRQALSLQHDTMTCPPKANGLMAFSVGHRPTCADTHPQSPNPLSALPGCVNGEIVLHLQMRNRMRKIWQQTH